MDLLQSTIAAYGQDSSHVPAYSGPVFSAWPLSAPVSHATLSTQRYAIGLTCDLCYPQRGDVITCCVLHGNSAPCTLRCAVHLLYLSTVLVVRVVQSIRRVCV